MGGGGGRQVSGMCPPQHAGLHCDRTHIAALKLLAAHACRQRQRERRREKTREVEMEGVSAIAMDVWTCVPSEWTSR